MGSKYGKPSSALVLQAMRLDRLITRIFVVTNEHGYLLNDWRGWELRTGG